MPNEKLEFYRLPIPLDRDRFSRDLVRDLAETLAAQLGPEKAADLVSEIGERTGATIDMYYRAALKSVNLTRTEIAAALVDLKRRIEGDFYVIEQDEDKIVLGNRACPFGNKVLDRPALCMMTSSVFGAITSQNLGYAKVELKETIARRHKECRVVVYLRPTDEAERAPGREYHAGMVQAARVPAKT
jgi:predicted ArsR family transcriptional regulator